MLYAAPQSRDRTKRWCVLWRKRHKTFEPSGRHFAGMKHKPAMYALLDLQSTLGGDIQKTKERTAELVEAMRHVEAVIKMLDPQFSLRRVAVKRRRPNQWFRRCTLYRKAIDILRTAGA